MAFLKALAYRPSLVNPAQAGLYEWKSAGRYIKIETPKSWLFAAICWLFLRLDLVSTIFQNHELPSEVPKEIIERNKWQALNRCYVHLVPIVVSSSLIALNFANVFYQSIGTSDLSFNLDALQFAAKFHEIFIVTSLSAIVLHRIQYELLHGKGIPLGSILAGFQITDLQLLLSPAFWATTSTARSSKRRLHQFLVLLIAFMVILGAIVGPASAILMLPSPGWWKYEQGLKSFFSDLHTDGHTEPRFIMLANDSILWPSHVGVDTFPSYCNSTSNQVLPNCPLGGLSTLLGAASSSGSWLSGNTWNFTTQETGSLERSSNRIIEGGIANIEYLTQTSLISTSNFLQFISLSQLQGSDTKWSLSLPNAMQSWAPVTSVTCVTTYYGGDLASGPYSYITYTPAYNSNSIISSSSGRLSQVFIPLYENILWTYNISASLLDVFNNATGVTTLWVEVPENATTVSLGVLQASFGILLESPSDFIHVCGLDGTDCSTLNYSAKIETCSISANWQPIDLYIDLSTDSDIHSTAVNKPDFNVGYANPSILFDLNWANSALPPNQTVERLSATISTIIGGILAYNASSLGVAVSIFITDIMSRVGMDIMGVIVQTEFVNQSYIQYIPTGHLTSMGAIVDSNITEIDITLFRHGYSYSMEGITRQLAAGIMFLYILIVIIYTTITTKQGWSCLGLRSLYEVLVLAINSAPSQTLANTSAGIERFDTYKHIVKVGEVDGEYLALVVENDDKGKFVVPADGKKYK